MSPTQHSSASWVVLSHPISGSHISRNWVLWVIFFFFSLSLSPPLQNGRQLCSSNHTISLCGRRSVMSWQRLLGHLSSLFYLVPGVRLCKRFLKLVLRDQWDFLGESVVLSWPPTINSDLMWWSDARHMPAGVFTSLLNQIFSFDPLCRIAVGGAHLLDRFVSGR